MVVKSDEAPSAQTIWLQASSCSRFLAAYLCLRHDVLRCCFQRVGYVRSHKAQGLALQLLKPCRVRVGVFVASMFLQKLETLVDARQLRDKLLAVEGKWRHGSVVLAIVSM